jgi:dephospho-CoA kinase
MLLAVAFAGKIGSGKTTVTTALAKALGWPRASFGDFVRKVARERGVPETRRNLQELGTRLLESDAFDFCNSVLSSSGWRTGENLIMDGLRHVETVEIIRKLVQPAVLKIVSVSVSEATRAHRLRNRGESGVASIEAHSSEQQVTSVLQKHADLEIDGDRPLEIIVAELLRWIGNQQNN